MAQSAKRMTLALLATSAAYAWRHGDGRSHDRLRLADYVKLIQTAERGLIDIFFLADSYGIREDRTGLGPMRGFSSVVTPDALTLLSTLVTVTSHIGLVATASTTYNEPYNLARRLATLDHLSDGRAGWNVVTSGIDAEAHNFGLDQQLDNVVRYSRAREFLEVAQALWDSWEDGAVLADPESRTYFDDAKVHYVDHEGEHFRVRGPLNIPRPPQGHPVICQAGASETGWDFAAQTADVMYGKAISFDEGRRFYAEVKGRMAKYGRAPDQLKILPGLVTSVGRTEKEAHEKYRAVQDCLTEAEARAMLTHLLPGAPLDDVGFDDVVPQEPEIDAAAKRFRIFLNRDGRRLRLREIVDFISAGMGHLTLIGTPSQVADRMVEWVDRRGADGFNLMPQILPGAVEDFVDWVVPELQMRGVAPEAYGEGMLRDRLGLARPADARWRRPRREARQA
jgi:FMN-dependent oxidoreductase (nitrilotriacetate monooxygenase family)